MRWFRPKIDECYVYSCVQLSCVCRHKLDVHWSTGHNAWMKFQREDTRYNLLKRCKVWRCSKHPRKLSMRDGLLNHHQQNFGVQ